MTLDGKVAIVTGGRRGIGLAIVKELQSQGCKVAIVAKSDDCPECDLYLKFDLRQLDWIGSIADLVVEKLGRVDILVNNAGSQYVSKTDRYFPNHFKDDLALMLMAPFSLAQQVHRHMAPGSHIVNILSTSAFQGARNVIGYVSAKHGLLGLTRALAIEWAPAIHVNAVAPGLTDTDMAHNYITRERKAFLESITPSGRFSKPEEIADAVLYLVNSTNVYGQVITVDGGWMAKNG